MSSMDAFASSGPFMVITWWPSSAGKCAQTQGGSKKKSCVLRVSAPVQ